MSFLPDGYQQPDTKSQPYYNKIANHDVVRILKGFKDEPKHSLMFYKVWTIEIDEDGEEKKTPYVFPYNAQGKIDATTALNRYKREQIEVQTKIFNAGGQGQKKYEAAVRKIEKEELSFCWVVMVYHLRREEVMLWEFKSKLLQKRLVELIHGDPNDEEAKGQGDPWEYDIEIIINEETPSDYYRVKLKDRYKAPDEWYQQLEAMDVDVRQLLVGGNPFNVSSKEDDGIPALPAPTVKNNAAEIKKGFVESHQPPPDSPELRARETRVRGRKKQAELTAEQVNTMVENFINSVDQIETEKQFREFNATKKLNDLITQTQGKMTEEQQEAAQRMVTEVHNFFFGEKGELQDDNPNFG